MGQARSTHQQEMYFVPNVIEAVSNVRTSDLLLTIQTMCLTQSSDNNSHPTKQEMPCTLCNQKYNFCVQQRLPLDPRHLMQIYHKAEKKFFHFYCK